MPDRKIVPWFRHIPMSASLALPSTGSHLFCLNDGQRYIVRRLLNCARGEEQYAVQWNADGTYTTPSAAQLDDIFENVDELEDELMGTLAYETGTQIVSFQAVGGGAISLVTTCRTLAWTRVGRLVTCTGLLQVESVLFPSGLLKLHGLPFVCASGLSSAAGFGQPAYGLTSGAVAFLMGVVNPGAATAQLQRYVDGGLYDVAAYVVAGTTFWIGFSYFAAA